MNTYLGKPDSGLFDKFPLVEFSSGIESDVSAIIQFINIKYLLYLTNN